jgi:hypothetical protein
MRKEQLRLGAFFYATGHHVAGWRHPSSEADGGLNLQRYIGWARRAEEAKFDLMFLEDGAGIRDGNLRSSERTARSTHFEPVTLLSALAAVTSRIGLVATTSTSFNEPYNVARRFASLDHLSGGRAGWNLVTSATDLEAANFGNDTISLHADRYERAEEFIDVVLGLWNSWDDDAVIIDRESGHFSKSDGFRPLNHKGKHFTVRGPLNISRTPQGQPVTVQAGSSGPGRDLSAHGRLRTHDTQESTTSNGRGGGIGRRLPPVLPLINADVQWQSPAPPAISAMSGGLERSKLAITRRVSPSIIRIFGGSSEGKYRVRVSGVTAPRTGVPQSLISFARRILSRSYTSTLRRAVLGMKATLSSHAV